MPLLKLLTSKPIPEDRRVSVLAACSKALAETTGKPEKYCMAILEDGAILMAGQPVSGAFLDIRGIGGLNPAVNAKLSQRLAALLQRELGIEPGNVYLNFSELQATHWGWNGSTFG